MYLKSVEVVGFKSFADKTKLELKPGITAIIGPNGCGKSNINESIRWCIGEMSWKSLRSTAMIDVIFAGTARRQPQNLAEVTLTFDNTKGLLPMPFSEITVTRKLFRSGESEYYLNKTQCRLRDIKELFLDTGIGGDGYAIIDQGGVDFVIKAKPEDRRALFEEAAGVSKYKAKREEALRKLERVEQDLARLNDSMALINEQIRKLDNDARKAKLYQKYKEELTGLEVAQVLGEVGTIASELETESARIAPIRESFEARSAELHAEEGRLAALLLERTGLQAQAAEANQALAEVKADLSRFEERLANNARADEELRRRDASAAAEIDRDAARLAELEPELGRAQAAADAAAQREAEARAALEDFENAAGALDERYAEAGRELEALKARALESSQQAIDASGTVSRAESTLGHAELELRQAQKDLARQTEKAAAGRAELEAHLARIVEAQAAADDARQAMVAVEEAAQAIATRRTELDAEAFEARSEGVRLKATAEALRAQGSQDPYWAGAHAVLSASIPGVLGTVRSMLKVDDTHARAVEDVLGERLYALVCENASSAQAAVDFLRGTGQGRARMLVLDTVPASGSEAMALPAEATPLLARVQADPRFESALRLLLGESYALGSAVYGRHWVCGGSAPAEGLDLKLADLRDLESRIAESARREEALASRRSQLDADAAGLAERLASARAACDERVLNVRTLDALKREREESLALAERDAQLYRDESARLEATVESAKAALAAAREALSSAQQRETELRAREVEAAAAVETLRVEAAERRMKRHELESRLAIQSAERQVAQKDFDARAVEKESLESSAARRREERELIARRLEECAAVEAEARAETERLQVRRGEVEAQVRGHADRLAEMDRSASELEDAIRTLKAACAEAQEQLHQWEVQASGLKARQDSLKSRLWDEWQLPFEDASARYGAVAVDAERLQSLRKRIQGMGNINMAAPEEYEALTQKHGFLQTQVADLAKAKDDLREAINKINATTRENFRQTFSDVREHFRRIYASLFEGGEAELVLTQPDNLLETGIDIVAQPPGKRLQSISLLSGGEKTLTAIALLFAFFMVRPSPVCMLDEADAALDEANTERFAAMLREFSSKTQFIVVSHSKRTIEAAEHIYGVTMEEGGVSTLISVDFRRSAEGTVAPAPAPAASAPEPEAVAAAVPAMQSEAAAQPESSPTPEPPAEPTAA